MKKFSKKTVIGIAVISVLFIGGIVTGTLVKPKSTVKTVSLTKDMSYENLLSGVKYSIPKKDTVKKGDKINANFNIVAEDLTPEQVKSLAKKIYENTVSKQEGLNSVQVNVFGKEGKSGDLVNGFYTDGLKYKITYDKEFNSVRLLTFKSVPGIKESVNKSDWAINNIFEVDGLVKVEIAIPEETKEEVVMAETKGLLAQVKGLNPKMKIDIVEANITSVGSNGWAYNSESENILAKVEKSTIK